MESDSDRKRVYDHTMAAVDIHSNTAWYKLCFPDSDQSRAHPLRQRLRLAPDKKGKGKETLVEAWISDQDVEQYVLHMAPGFTIANDPVDPELYRKPSDSASQSASCVCRREMDEALAQNKLGRVGKDSRGESLKDLLDAEKRKKRKPIGTSRTIGVNKEWEVENGGQTFRVQNKGQTEAARAHHEGAPSKELTMKQTLALAAVARQVPSSTAVEQSSAEARFSSAQPVSLVVNSAHHKSKPLLGELILVRIPGLAEDELFFKSIRLYRLRHSLRDASQFPSRNLGTRSRMVSYRLKDLSLNRKLNQKEGSVDGFLNLRRLCQPWTSSMSIWVGRRLTSICEQHGPRNPRRMHPRT